jgi:hypothetical protein
MMAAVVHPPDVGPLVQSGDLEPGQREHEGRPPAAAASIEPADPCSIRGLCDHPASDVRLCDVLSAWRAAERELAGHVEGSPTWVCLQAAMSDLRSLHARLFDERSASLHHGAAPRLASSQAGPTDGGGRP